jgi:hypothetical protein
MPKRVDQNHKALITALRAWPGVTVFSLHSLSRSKASEGIPDCCVGYKGCTVLCEIKGPKGKLSTAQIAWHATWTGTPVVVLRTEGDVAWLIETLETHYQAARHLCAALEMEITVEKGGD